MRKRVEKVVIDYLPRFTVSVLSNKLPEGVTLADLDRLLKDSRDKAEGICEYSSEGVPVHRFKIEIRKDTDLDLLYIVFVYHKQRGNQVGEEQRVRYYLQKKESNLIPGTYLYYFVDPYSETLCNKLYIYDGRILPRSVLSKEGIRYKQQLEGHKQRYLWTFYNRVPDWEEVKYRKSHYRGNITPFWSRYLYLQEERDRRVFKDLESMNLLDWSDLQVLSKISDLERI